MRDLRVAPPIFYDDLVEAMRLGHSPTVASVWATLVYEFLNFYMLWSAVAHLKVGLWRLFGYDIEPYFQKPFLATNLLELWKRYSYYYKEFLVQTFYWPVFLRFFKSLEQTTMRRTGFEPTPSQASQAKA